MEGEQKIYDLEERTLAFSKRIVFLANALSLNNVNDVIIKQIVRSGTSVGANYREANDALGNKDFLYRLRIARKEAKETVYWLELLIENNPELEKRMYDLHNENVQIVKILSRIISNTEKKQKEGL